MMQQQTQPISPNLPSLTDLLSQRSQSNSIKLNIDDINLSITRPNVLDESRYQDSLRPITHEHPFFKILSQVMARQGHPLSLPRAVAALENLMGPVGPPLKDSDECEIGSFSLPLEIVFHRNNTPLPLSYLLLIRDWNGHLVFDLHRLGDPNPLDSGHRLSKSQKVRLFQTLFAYIEGSARFLRPKHLPSFRRVDHTSGVMYGLEGGTFFFQGRGD